MTQMDDTRAAKYFLLQDVFQNFKPGLRSFFTPKSAPDERQQKDPTFLGGARACWSVGRMMFRLFALVCLMQPSIAFAQVDCAQAEVRFVEVMGHGKDDLFRADLAEAVADSSTRWIFAVSAYLGVALPVENGSATPEQAALLVATDPLLDCWRIAADIATEADLLQMQRIDTLLSTDRRATLANLAVGLQ